MMTQQLEVSILTAPLAAIDPRTLSQAWYSALHGARNGVPMPQAGSFVLRATRTDANASARKTSHGVQPLAAGVRQAPNVQERLRTRATATPLYFSGRERARLALRIERAFSGWNRHPHRATFSLGPGSARVHIVLQTKGGQATLIALCPPELRAIVRGALAEARAALALRGLALLACAVGGDRCS